MTIPNSDGQSSHDAGSGPHERRFKIIYASQTGTAEDLAERIARQAERKRWEAQVVNVADYEVTDLIDESSPLLFLIATTGNGTFPTSASTFWRFLLRRDLPADILGDLRCSIFGLGDSTYAKFCWPARLLRRRLASLGAETEFSKGEDADEQHLLGIEGALQPFLEAFWARLEEWQPKEKGVEEIPEDQLLPPRYEVRLVPEQEAAAAASTTALSPSCTLRQRYGIARLTRNERMTAKDHFQDVRLLEFADTRRSVQLPDDFARAGPSRLPMTAAAGAERRENGHAGDAEEDADAGPGEMQYDAGDVMCVKPENSEAHVERFLQRMGWEGDRERLVHIASRSSARTLPPEVPSTLTLHDLLKQHLDIASVPRPSFFHAIRPFSPAGSLEREKLDEYCTPGEGAEDMFDYAMRVRRTILECLEEFQSVQIPLEYLLEAVPFLRERQFSIASHPDYLAKHHDEPEAGDNVNGHAHANDSAEPGAGATGSTPTSSQRLTRLQLAVAIVRYRTRLREPRRGVCTAWLASLPVGSEVLFSIERGTMALPAQDESPVVYIGPGTGVAPMRSFLQKRLLHAEQGAAKESSDAGAAPGKNRIYLGFRHSAKDFLFEADWRRWSSAGLLDWRLAPSREDAENKVYVQDLLREDKALLWKIIGEQNGTVLISGSAGKMPEAVRDALKEACIEEGGMDEEQALRFLSTMEAQKRLQEECWS